MNENSEPKFDNKEEYPNWDQLTDQVSIDEQFPNPDNHLRTHQEEIAKRKFLGDSGNDLQEAA